MGEARHPGPTHQAGDLEHIVDQFTGERFRIWRAPGDGNCLFHSLARGLNWLSYRALKADMLRFYPQFIRDIAPQGLFRGAFAANTLHVLHTDGAWGEHEHIELFAARYHCTVIIHQPTDVRIPIGHGHTIIHLYWLNHNHYDLLLPVARPYSPHSSPRASTLPSPRSSPPHSPRSEEVREVCVTKPTGPPRQVPVRKAPRKRQAKARAKPAAKRG